MPNRMIRDSARTSRTLNALSDAAERLFWRLILAADDYGRFDADPRVILAQCFPLWVGDVSPADIGERREELIAQDKIRIYEHDGREYGYFPSWAEHQRIRN